jgi:hypothetical protein
VIFHPVQKSLNRLIQIDYTLRIQSLTQLYFYNGTSNVLVGPQSTTTSGFIFDTIADATDVDRPITQLYNNNNRIAIISEESLLLNWLYQVLHQSQKVLIFQQQ